MIRRASPVLGGSFYSHHYMHGENGWLDGYFLATKKPIFYNFAFQTVPYAYKEAVMHRAWNSFYELNLINKEPSIFKDSFKDPVSGLYVTPPREPVRYPELNGMTRIEWVQAQYQRIADSLEIQVFESWTLHHDYHQGVGLHATIDVPFLTVETVEQFIGRFLATETEFKGQSPRSFEFDQIDYWGLESNAICEPWDLVTESGSAHVL
jgi:hypothetical protein